MSTRTFWSRENKTCCFLRRQSLSVLLQLQFLFLQKVNCLMLTSAQICCSFKEHGLNHMQVVFFPLGVIDFCLPQGVSEFLPTACSMFSSNQKMYSSWKEQCTTRDFILSMLYYMYILKLFSSTCPIFVWIPKWTASHGSKTTQEHKNCVIFYIQTANKGALQSQGVVFAL